MICKNDENETILETQLVDISGEGYTCKEEATVKHITIFAIDLVKHIYRL